MLVSPAVQKLIDSNKLPHLLFYGPPGTGKTSTILACAKKLYGPDFKMMVLEVCRVLRGGGWCGDSFARYGSRALLVVVACAGGIPPGVQLGMATERDTRARVGRLVLVVVERDQR